MSVYQTAKTSPWSWLALLVLVGFAFLLAGCTGSEPSTARLEIDVVSGALFAQTLASDCEGEGCPPPTGSCCVDCEDGSGDEDQCFDEQREGECEELGGNWLVDVPCGQRDDCGDECPIPDPVGASCLPNGECVEDVTEAECEQAGCLDWQEDATCEGLTCTTPVPTMPPGSLEVLVVIGGLVFLALWVVTWRRSTR